MPGLILDVKSLFIIVLKNFSMKKFRQVILFEQNDFFKNIFNKIYCGEKVSLNFFAECHGKNKRGLNF